VKKEEETGPVGHAAERLRRPKEATMRITFKAFDSKMASREKLFKAALDFANKLKREDLINVTHTEDRDNIVVCIWYWSDEQEKREAVKAKVANPLAQMAGFATDGEAERGEGAPRSGSGSRTDLLPLPAAPEE